ncbi:MAG: transcriptional repressor [Candidatus Neomarinimicrobiota bacterium]|jgi:Fur family peroxide stress response transcriptional regulator
MKSSSKNIRQLFVEKGLKITPQRVAILEAIYKSDNHPCADNIIKLVHKDHPNIAKGTVYKVLDTLVESGLIQKVQADTEVMRYDGVTKKHHHLYCSECATIKDYYDEDLDKILENHFNNIKIDGFKIEDLVLQIKGRFDKC